MTTIEEIETALAALLAEGPQIVSDASTGEGGLGKIVKLASDATSLLSVFNSAIAAHPAVAAA
jgi:hypothetical protein